MPTTIQPTILHNTFVVERSYPVSAERLFAAFSDPAQKRKWLLESPTNQIEAYALDFRVGGDETARYRPQGTPFVDPVFTIRSNYQLIEPGKRIVASNTMAMNGNCISAALITFDFLPTGAGTDLICTHQAAFLEGSDGPEIRKIGWTTLLDKLGKALEA